MQENFSKFQAALILLIIFAVMFELNNLMPLHRDDYDYSMIWKTGEHLENFSDVFESTWRHYFLHGGRAFTVFCLSLFLWLGKFAFDVANALIFTALVVLIYLHARREIKFDEPKILAAAGLLAWLSFPHFGEVAIWKSGSTVYLWSAVPVALFLLPYNLTLAGKNFGNSKIFAAIMFLLGIIAGCSVENLAVTTVLIVGAISFYLKKKNHSQLWNFAGIFGSLIGVIILLAAPGNFVRYDDQGAGKGILAHIGNQFAGNAEMCLYLLPLILLMICIFSNKKSDKKIFTAVMFAIAAIFAVSYFNDSFITRTLHNFLVENIFPNFNPSVKFLERFKNFMEKSEEMIIYAAILAAFYSLLKSEIDTRKTIRLEKFRYAEILFGLAIFNNFVMIAAPTFPARATFSSVVMILIGALSILRNSDVMQKISYGKFGQILKIGATVICSFTLISALVITSDLRRENDLRIEAVKLAATKNEPVVTFLPIEIKNRALRHVFFVDFDNSVTKNGLCEFYGIKDIEIASKIKICPNF